MTRQFYKSSSGAKEGLQQKMLYWKEKEYRTEYNILIGQALNLAVQDGGHDDSEGLRLAKEYFKMLLTLRQDPELRVMFDEYYREKLSTEKLDNGEKVD